MSGTNLLISILALVVAAAALWLLLRNARLGGGAVRGIANYTIAGNVTITNDCDGQLNSIPNQVMVRTSLSNAAGTIQVPGDVVINVLPDAANPNNPVKVGKYSITVRWLDAQNDPAHWTSPEVLDQFGGTSVCVPIVCPPGGECRNMVAAANVPVGGLQTNHDVQVVCSCQ